MQLLWEECGYPRWSVVFTLPNAIFFYYLFSDFYNKAYGPSDKGKKHNGAVTNGVANGDSKMTNGDSKITNGGTKITNGDSKMTNGSSKKTNGEMKNGESKIPNGNLKHRTVEAKNGMLKDKNHS